ncbi:MAG TPA: amidohydrolase family protein [Gaiellaceae bacterium]|nr:amidohydrolase family protein [Gaiellaceae bacterium]
MSAPLVLENGLVDVGGGEFRRGDLAMADGRIVAAAPEGAERIDCSRFLVVPGMVNAHNHSNENWFRGMWDNLPLEPWMLFSYPALAAPAQSPDEIYLRTLLGAIEQLRSGATCVVDFLYELDGFTDETLAAVVRAYRDVGLRALIALGIGDRAYHETVVLDEGLVSRELVDRLEREKPPTWEEWERFIRGAVERFHRPDEGISICPGPSGPQRCTDEMLVGCAALADQFEVPIHIHVLETRMQAVSGQRMYGKTLVEHMDAIGFLGPRVCFAHGIWLTERDIEIVRDRDVSIAHNPVSNMKLGSGLAAVPALLAAGVNVALGTDGMSSNDGLDMFASLKQAALLHKLWGIDYERWTGALEAWRVATIGGARAAGDEEGLGGLEPGRRADVVLLDLDSHVFTPLNHPLHQLAFGSSTLAVDSVLVGGEWKVRGGRVVSMDEADVLARARDVGSEIVGRFDEAFELGRQLLAPLRGGWLEALRTEVGVERKLTLSMPPR